MQLALKSADLPSAGGPWIAMGYVIPAAIRAAGVSTAH